MELHRRISQDLTAVELLSLSSPDLAGISEYLAIVTCQLHVQHEVYATITK